MAPLRSQTKLAAALLVGLLEASAWRTSGVLPVASHFQVFAGRFCFDYKPGPNEEAGKFELYISGRVKPQTPIAEAGTDAVGVAGAEPPCWGPSCETGGNLYLMVFDDEEDHWQQASDHWSSLTCKDLLRYSSFALPIGLPELSGELNRTVFVQEQTQPRFWYFTFAACGIEVVEQVVFDIHTQNILQGLQSEFGADERGCLEMQLFASLLFLALGMYLRNIARRATGAEALRSRPLLRILLLSALCSAAGGACLALHYFAFMFDGIGLSLLEVIGQVWVCVAKALLTLLQLLTAKGWALFYAPEEVVQRRLMLGIVGGVVLTSIACEIHADYFNDSSTSLYLYESWPGIVILFLNVILFGEAWRSMRETYRHETSDEVRIFYGVISLAALVYFLTLPVMCAFSSTFDPWHRAMYIGQAEVASRFIATVLLAFCLRPSRLDAMVNARLEDGLKTVGEERDDTDEEDRDIDGHEAQECLLPRSEREAADDRELAACAKGIVGPAE